MMSIRYERRLPTKGGDDLYNAFASSPFSSRQAKKIGNSMEYWTNGTTILLINPITTTDAAANTVKNRTFIAKIPSSSSSSSSSSSKTPTKSSAGNGNQVSRATSRGHPQNQTKARSHQQQHHVVRNSLIAGSMAGIISTLICHPLDMIRTKMQTSASVTQVLSRKLQQGGGGLRSLYSGMAFPLATQAVYKATIFTIYNLTQAHLVEWGKNELLKTGRLEPYSLTLMDCFICGAMGGAINAALFVTPVEYVRHRVGQPQHSICHPHRPALFGPDVVQNIIRLKSTLLIESPRGLWRGVGITVARDALGCGCFFYALAWSRKLLAAARTEDHAQQQHPSVSDNIVSGAVAGLAYWAVALPLDRLKTTTYMLQQQRSYSKGTMGTTTTHNNRVLSATQVVQTSLRERGPLETAQLLLTPTSRASHYHNGMGMVCYARGIPSSAIVAASYSFCYDALQQRQ